MEENFVTHIKHLYQEEDVNNALPIPVISGHKGITWNKLRRKWRARMSVDGRQKSIGYFHNIETALKALDKFQSKL